MRKVNKLFRIFWWPLIIIVSDFIIGIGIFNYYFAPSVAINQRNLLEVEALVTALATFTGIFVPLLISRNWKKEDDRRNLVFMLGMLWTELRKNAFVLEQIKVNYKFKGLFVIVDFKSLMKIVLGKYKFVHIATNELHGQSFVASQNSSVINTFDNDDVFNDVTQAYENITNFRLASLLTLETLKMKDWLIKFSPEPITSNEELMFKTEIQECLKNTYKELLFLKTVTERAIRSVDTKLSEMGVVSSQEFRNLEVVSEIP